MTKLILYYVIGVSFSEIAVWRVTTDNTFVGGVLISVGYCIYAPNKDDPDFFLKSLLKLIN